MSKVYSDANQRQLHHFMHEINSMDTDYRTLFKATFLLSMSIIEKRLLACHIVGPF
jgi:hypothetical protein